jgi:MFS family permease
MMDLCRAIQGLGPAAFLVAGVMLLGSYYRPGPRKNLAFAIYGAMAPFGFYIGIFFAGFTAQFTTWRWYFFVAAILGAIVLLVTYLCCPNDHAERKGMGVKMDWWGALTICVGLILVVFAITDSAQAAEGWATPYIIATMALGVLVLGLAVYIEGWVAEQPLVPFELFKVPYMGALCIAMLFSWGSMGMLILYMVY